MKSLKNIIRDWLNVDHIEPSHKAPFGIDIAARFNEHNARISEMNSAVIEGFDKVQAALRAVDMPAIKAALEEHLEGHRVIHELSQSWADYKAGKERRRAERHNMRDDCQDKMRDRVLDMLHEQKIEHPERLLVEPRMKPEFQYAEWQALAKKIAALENVNADARLRALAARAHSDAVSRAEWSGNMTHRVEALETITKQLDGELEGLATALAVPVDVDANAQWRTGARTPERRMPTAMVYPSRLERRGFRVAVVSGGVNTYPMFTCHHCETPITPGFEVTMDYGKDRLEFHLACSHIAAAKGWRVVKRQDGATRTVPPIEAEDFDDAGY